MNFSLGLTTTPVMLINPAALQLRSSIIEAGAHGLENRIVRVEAMGDTYQGTHKTHLVAGVYVMIYVNLLIKICRQSGLPFEFHQTPGSRAHVVRVLGLFVPSASQTVPD